MQILTTNSNEISYPTWKNSLYHSMTHPPPPPLCRQELAPKLSCIFPYVARPQEIECSIRTQLSVYETLNFKLGSVMVVFI